MPEPWEPDGPGRSSFSFQVVESGHSLLLGEGRGEGVEEAELTGTNLVSWVD